MAGKLEHEPTIDDIEEEAANMFGNVYWCEHRWDKLINMEHAAEQKLMKKALAKQTA